MISTVLTIRLFAIECQIESTLQCELYFLDFREDLHQDSSSDCKKIFFFIVKESRCFTVFNLKCVFNIEKSFDVISLFFIR